MRDDRYFVAVIIANECFVARGLLRLRGLISVGSREVSKGANGPTMAMTAIRKPPITTLGF